VRFCAGRGRRCSDGCSSACTTAASTISTPRISPCSSIRGRRGAKPSELATRLRVSKQALNYLLGELERLGYLERRPDPDDLRSKRVALTKRGTSVALVMRDAVAEVESEWAEQLGPRRFGRLRDLLHELDGG
jgi:DNA-binding MarR family transcriptional regulator